MDLNQILANLYFFGRGLITAAIATFIIAAIVMFLWNWQLVAAFSFPTLSYWTTVAIVGIIQVIKLRA
jgi:hypothetical protein